MKPATGPLLGGALLLLLGALPARADVVPPDILPHAQACFSQYDLLAKHATWGQVPARMQPATAQMATLSLSPSIPADWNKAPIRFYVLASCEPGKVVFAVTS